MTVPAHMRWPSENLQGAVYWAAGGMDQPPKIEGEKVMKDEMKDTELEGVVGGGQKSVPIITKDGPTKTFRKGIFGLFASTPTSTGKTTAPASSGTCGPTGCSV